MATNKKKSFKSCGKIGLPIIMPLIIFWLSVILESDPEYSESNKYRNYWGYEADMLKNVAEILNFKYTIENPPDGSWGHINADGTWNGLGMISHMMILVFNNFWNQVIYLTKMAVAAKNDNQIFLKSCYIFSIPVYHASQDIIDFVICDVFITYSRSMVIHNLKML